MPSIFASYELTETLVEHSDGSLHRARNRETNALALVQRPSARLTIEEGRQKLLREAGVLTQLAGVPGVAKVQSLQQTPSGDALVLKYFAGEKLTDRLARNRPSVGQWLTWALTMADLIDAVHRAGFLHRTLCPASFLVDAENQILLLDFGLASPVTEERRPDGGPEPVRDWSCLAPEQTGRIHVTVDRRTDYYALGMVLYTLAAGEPAFAVQSPLEAVHAHLAKVPPPPRGCPAGVADVILKLLAKAPDQRYQSMTGLVADLSRCLEGWKAEGRVDPFPLGADDLADRLRVTRRLFDRGAEVEALRAAYDNSLQGNREAVVLAGPSGVGKSTLAAEAGSWVIADQGFFLVGKHDDSQREQPYAAVVQMIEDLTRQIARRPDRAEWKKTFAEALGDNQAVVAALAPAFEGVTGPLPPPPPLPPRETENRFLYTMEAFFRALGAPGRSLVLFFDDLQWVDPASARLLDYLAKDGGRVLVLYSYRTNEPRVSESFPALREVLDSVATRPRLVLEALSPSAIESWVAETLGAPVRSPEALAQTLWTKTGGSPFFLIQLVRRLHREGLLHYDRPTRQWDWDAPRLGALPASENVSDLLITQFQTLPPSASALLGIGACLGTTVYSSDLEAFRDALPDLAEALWPLIDQQYFIPQSDGYLALGTAEYRSGAIEAPAFTLRFQHDRIRQAAYGQLDPSTKAAIHLKAARTLEPTRPIEAAGHYLAVMDRLTEPAQRDQLARLLVRVGDLARASSATRQALDFFRQARALADEGRLLEAERRRLLLLLAETAFVCHETEEAMAVSAALLAQLTAPVERAEVLMMEMDAFTFLGRMDEALDRGRKALAVLGVSLAVRPNPVLVGYHLVKVLAKTSRRDTEQLFQRRGQVPSRARLLIRLLGKFLVPAQMSGNATLFALSTLMATEQALQHGNSEETSAAFGNFAILLSVLGRHRQAFEYSSLAMRLEQVHPNPKSAAMVHASYSFFSLPWNRPWVEVPPAALRGAEAARRSGDLFFMAYQPLFAGVFSTPPLLADMIVGLEETQKIIAATRQEDALVGCTFALQRWRALAGERVRPEDFSAPDFDEARAVQSWEAKKNSSGLAVYHLYKVQVLTHLGRWDEAWNQWQKAQPHVPTILGSAYMEEYAVYTIVLVAETMAANPGRRGLGALSTQRRRLRQWSTTCPENFGALHWWAEAEEAAARGRHERAADAFRRAIEGADASLHVRWRALIHERAGRYHLRRGEKTFGGYLLADAHRLYALWGARECVRTLERDFPFLSGTSGSSWASERSVDSDAASLWKVSQVISREMDVDRLLAVVVQAVIENAGARRGWLLLKGDEGWEAVVRGEAEAAAVAFASRVSPEAEGIPATVLAAAQDHEALLVASATKDPRFSGDPVVRARGLRSLLALRFSPPGSSLEALWYLENDLVEGAFSNERLGGLTLLSGQVGISLENARMYRALSNLNHDLEGKVRDRTDELEEKNRQFLHSVEYAGVLQRSLLPREWGPSVADRFALWVPKDIVGGDLYWYRESTESCLLALVDCTGHGVPGALITVLVQSLLDDAFRTAPAGDLSAILAQTHRQFRRALGQHRPDSESNDGFDLGLLWWSPSGGDLRYAGARISLLHSAGGELMWVHGGRRGLGYHETPDSIEATVQTLPRTPGARYYLTTDGYLGQVGGEKDISFGRERFTTLLSRTAGLPMEDQGHELKRAFDEYRGSRNQADDITVLGVQLR